VNIVVWIISIITLFCSYKLFKAAAGTLSLCKFNTIVYVFYYCVLMSTFIGAILCALGYGEDHWILCYAKEEARIKAWLAVCYSMITMPLGMILLNNVLGIRAKTAFESYMAKPMEFGMSNRRLRVILVLMCGFSILMFFYIKHYSGSWPLYTALIEHDYLAASEGRIDVRLNFHGLIYIKNLGGLCLVPLFSFFAYIVSIKRKSLYFRICFIFLLICTLLILSYDTQKAPIIFYAMGYLIVHVLVKGTIPLKKILIFVGLALFIMGVMYASFNATTSGALDIILDPKSALWGRMFISGYAGVPLSFEWFPDVITQPTWQIGLPEFLLNLFDLPTTESARLLMLKINPSGNLISSYFIAEAWANYGLLGVIISPVIVGINVQIIQIFLLKSPKNPLAIAFYAFMTTRWVISSGFANYLFFKAILIPFVLYFLCRFVINRLVIRV